MAPHNEERRISSACHLKCPIRKEWEMTDEFKKRISDAAKRQSAKSEEKQLSEAKLAAEEAAQAERRAKASSMMNGSIKDAFSLTVKEVNNELSGTGKHLTVGSKNDGYFLDIASREGPASRGADLPNASIFVDQDGNLVTTYSNHASLRKFRPPEEMRPEKYSNETIQKVVGDLVDAITS